jgi:glycosyltransferase involved in cell wall biosynthesis
MNQIKVLITAEHASKKFGGEAVLPLHYFRLLNKRGFETRLIVHERTKAELDALFPNEKEFIFYIKDTAVHIWLLKFQQLFPRRLGEGSVGVLFRLFTQYFTRMRAKELIKKHGINIVHQPIPVSPKDPSLMVNLDVPVVIGPLNGGMNYPDTFKGSESKWVQIYVIIARFLSNVVNHLIRGKIEAAVILVANSRTKNALPVGIKGSVIEIVENGVDLNDFAPPNQIKTGPANSLNLVFVGRLVDWKCLDIAIEAIKSANTKQLSLTVLGDGPMKSGWQQLAKDLGIAAQVNFKGWVSPEEVAEIMGKSDALVLPSVYECGGAVVLEAMAKGIPVIASKWGGPADYLDNTTGILIEATNKMQMVNDFANAFDALAKDPEYRKKLAIAALAKVTKEFDWEYKIDCVLNVYKTAIENHK